MLKARPGRKPALSTFSILLTFATLTVCTNSRVSAQSAEVEIWPDLKPGPYGVGYTIRHEYDYSRTFQKKFDYFGQRVEDEIARPLQITIWYPVAMSAGAENMRLAEYFHALATETSFTPPTADELEARVEGRKQVLMAEWGIAPPDRPPVKAALDSIFSIRTPSVRDARPAEGKFPLILHMPGYNSSAIDHSPLFEHLASHGYVIASVPNMGRYSRGIDDEAASLDVQARDLEFLFAIMRNFPYVDPERIGTTGMSWGGMSNILFAQRNSYVDAVVTLDGAITMPVELNLIEAVPGYSHTSFRAAYLQLMVSPQTAQFRPKDLRFWDALRYSEAYMCQFEGVSHDDFAPGYMRLRNLVEPDPERIEYLDTFASVMCRYVRWFFDATLKGDQEARALLDATHDQIGVSSSMLVRAEAKPALTQPPTQDEFAAILLERGVETAERIWREVTASNPEVTLIESPLFGPLYMDALNAGELDQALAICRLWALGMPDAVGPLFSLARVHVAMGDKNQAIACYERVLELVGEGRSADTARRAIEELRIPPVAQVFDTP
ncbi:dienelactone hydrolase family protein [Gemmatimonadota bacterium]